MNNLKSMIREIPDFPKPGILFGVAGLLLGSFGLVRPGRALGRCAGGGRIGVGGEDPGFSPYPRGALLAVGATAFGVGVPEFRAHLGLRTPRSP